MKPSQGELNTALKPVFAHIYNTHLIHDDLIFATKTDDEHVKAIKEAMKAISGSGLTLNPNKCSFGQKHIILGIIYRADGINLDPAKVEALDHISPNNKEELISFLCSQIRNLLKTLPRKQHLFVILQRQSKIQVKL